MRLYLEEGNEKEAIRCAEQSMRYRDSSLIQESHGRFLMANRFYDINLAEKRLRDAELKLKRGVFVTLGISIIACACMFLYSVQQRKNQKAARREIAKQRQEVYSLQRVCDTVRTEYTSLREEMERREKSDQARIQERTMLTYKLNQLVYKGSTPDKELWGELLRYLCDTPLYKFVEIEKIFPRLSEANKNYLALVLVGIDGQAAATLLGTSRQNVLRIRNKYKQKLKELGVEETSELKDMLESYLERQVEE